MKPTVALVVSISLVSVMHAGQAQDAASLFADTRKTTLPVLPRVAQAMQTAVQENGPVGAIPVCKEKAPQLLQEMRRMSSSASTASTKAWRRGRATGSWRHSGSALTANRSYFGRNTTPCRVRASSRNSS